MNFFGRRRQASPQRPTELKRETPEELEAKLRMLELTLKAKQLENWFSQTCVKQCCKLDQELMDDSESLCLDNCHTKYGKFLQTYKNVATQDKKQ